MSDTPSLPAEFRLLRLGTVDSTNEEARRRALAGEASGLLIWAEAQAAGRGRQGRIWSSPPGNLYCSLLLRPRLPVSTAALLSFVAAVAAAETVAASLPEGAAPVTCKWPNDVLVAGAKIAGILLESRTGTGGGLEWIVIGTGINIASYPAVAAYPTTSLGEHGSRADVGSVLELYADRLAHWLAVHQVQGFAPVRAAWLARAEGLGRTLQVRLGQAVVAGVFESLDAAGALVLKTPEGRRAVTAGEVLRVA